MNKRLLSNIAWSWGGVAVTLISAAVVPRFVVGHLGVAAYGLWALALSLVEYFWLIDLGFRPATVKLTAQYQEEDRPRINEVVNSGLFYGAGAGMLVVLVIWLLTGRIAGWYNPPEETRAAFETLIRMVGVMWGAGLVFNILSAGIEGLQRFDLTGRIWIASTAVRAVGTLAAVAAGYGLEAMGWVMMVAQGAGYLATLAAWRSVYPEFRLSTAHVTRRMLGEQLRFGWKMMPGVVSGRLVAAVLPTQIGRILGVKSVSYHSLSLKLIEYAADAVGRVGLVAGPQATQLITTGRRDELIELGKNGNRYSLTVWLLPAVYLLVYRYEFYQWWLGREVAEQCSRLLPPLLLAHTAVVSQFISNAILMGLGRFERYSWSLMVEGVLTLAGIAFILPRWGLEGGMWWIALMLVSNRCVNLLRVSQREMGFEPIDYVRSIYPAPLAAGVVSLGACYLLRPLIFAAGPPTLLKLAGAGVAHVAVYGILAAWWCLKTEHRHKLMEWVRARLG